MVSGTNLCRRAQAGPLPCLGGGLQQVQGTSVKKPQGKIQFVFLPALLPVLLAAAIKDLAVSHAFGEIFEGDAAVISAPDRRSAAGALGNNSPYSRYSRSLSTGAENL